MSNVPRSVMAVARAALVPPGIGPAAHAARPESAAAGAPASLKHRAVRGSAWSMTEYAAGMMLRFGGNLVLTRLLVPEMFGLMALVNIFIQGLGMFSDVGIGPSIIQNARGDDPKFYNTAWTIQVFRGVTLWICSCLIAVPLAHFYELPALAWLIPVAGLSALISGFNSTSLFRLNRHLELRKISLLSITTNVACIVGMIAWALIHRSVWALLVPPLIARLLQMLGSHLLLPEGRNTFHWDPEARAALFRFGRWIFLSTLLNFTANQADRLIFGKQIPLDLLGVYGIALMLATMPTGAIIKLGSSVVFPAYSSVRRDAAHFGRVFGKVRFALLSIGAAAITGLIATGPMLIAVLYDWKWADAGWILQLLAVGAWFQILESPNSSALLAHGRAQWMAAGFAAKILGLVVLIPLGFRFYGFWGAIAGVALADTLRYAISVVAIRGLNRRVLLSDTVLSLAIAAAVTVTMMFGHWLRHLSGRNDVALAGSLVLVALIWAPVWAVTWRHIRAPRERSASGPETTEPSK